MKKLLITTTALSVAFSPVSLLPARAQTLLDDGSVVAEDGSILCTPTAEAPCDLKEIRRAARQAARAAERAATDEAEAAAAAAAQAEAAAAAAAQAEAEAAAAAQAEAEAAAAAQAEAEAAAAAEAEAEAAAAAQAEAEAAAAAQAEAEAAAAAQAEAEAAAAAQAEAEAAAAAQAEAEAEAAAAAQAEAEAAAAAAATEPTVETATEAPAPEATAETATESDTETATGEAPVVEPTAEEPTSEPAAETAAEPAVEPDTAVEAEVVAQPEPVEAPVPEPEAVETLTELLSAPSATEGAEGEGTEVLAPTVAAAAAAAAIEGITDPGLVEGTATGETPTEEQPEVDPEAAPVTVTEQVITEEDTRSSEEEFAAAPTAVEGGKKSGLSDLEKVGLVALGGLIVGAILNDGKKVVSNSGDRVVVENPDGRYTVYKDDDTLLRRPGVRTVTESYRDGSTRTIVQRADGTQVVTVRDAAGRVLRRSAFDRNGVEILLIDDLYPEEPIVIRDLPKPKPSRVTISSAGDDAALKAEMAALQAEELGRKFSLRQIREIPEVRALAATIEVDNITFDTNSSVIRATEAKKLADIGRIMGDILDRNPREVFLIEGHTDAVGSAASNLALSDRRAESLALALTEYFDIPPENIVVQGYGEAELKVETQGDERANRRVAIRLVTPLMQVARR